MTERTGGGPGLRTALSTLTGPLRFLLLSSFLIPLGSFMVLPFMSVFLHERLGMGLGAVGVVLAAASLVQFSGGILGGALADRVGLRRTMVWALVVRTAGFAAFLAALRWPPMAVGALILTCCGAALYLPANKAYLVHGVAEERRPAFLSAGNAALNAGMAVGPLVAGPFVLSSPGPLFLGVTALFAVVAVGHVRLPAVGAEGGRSGPVRSRSASPAPSASASASERAGGQGLLAGVAVLPFVANGLAFYLYFHFQHYLAVYAVQRTSSEFYSLVLLTCFVLVIVVQPLASGAIRRMRYPVALAIGFAGLAAGMAVLAYGTKTALLTGGVLITLGDIVLFLKNDLEALRRSSRSDAVVFGQQRLAAGLGACASGVLGGQLYGLGERAGHTGWFWLLAAVQCVLLPPLLLALRRGRGTAPLAHDLVHDGHTEGTPVPDDAHGRIPGR
ncbi:MFS transporter permease [Streptomyces sp. CB02923]|uniref:MFS transporter n=1 Tax=Streptomyces sp. CB02923 TaxID=1718985 RepID=UPI00093BD13D|nr:MFS transporter [Streptomyces sp. CB02923]OKI06160.1 MFS transporter permease [Streptomyces sp. CB02923]